MWTVPGLKKKNPALLALLVQKLTLMRLAASRGRCRAPKAQVLSLLAFRVQKYKY
jgi:hypothetical protein